MPPCYELIRSKISPPLLIVFFHFLHEIIGAHDPFFPRHQIGFFVFKHKERVLVIKRPFVPESIDNFLINLNNTSKNVDSIFFSVERHVAVVLCGAIRIAAIAIRNSAIHVGIKFTFRLEKNLDFFESKLHLTQLG